LLKLEGLAAGAPRSAVVDGACEDNAAPSGTSGKSLFTY